MGVDYTLSSMGPLVFAAGQVEKSLTINVLDDGTAAEGMQTVILSIGNVTAATPSGNVVYTLAITDND
jgi:hypothetical protein